MDTPRKRLPIQPPREYSLRDAYRGRVWRTPLTVIAREIFFWAIGMTLLCVAVNDMHWAVYSLSAGLVLGVVAVLSSLSKNRLRVRIIRTGLSATASMGRARRIPFLHELFRGKREATHRLPYDFRTADGERVHGGIWICGCALQYIEIGSNEPVAYDANSPSKNLPLRVAMMVAPH